jgi:hypothetical protein
VMEVWRNEKDRSNKISEQFPRVKTRLLARGSR